MFEEELAKFKRYGCKHLCPHRQKMGRCPFANKSDCELPAVFQNFIYSNIQSSFLDLMPTSTLVESLRRRGLTGELRELKTVII